jgi:PAS domain S-box-containing protein
MQEQSRDMATRGDGDRYRLLFEDNPQPMWVYDRGTFAFLTVNEAAVRKYGYSREEFLAMTIRDIRPPEDVPALLEAVSSSGPGLTESGVWRHRTKGGAIIDVEISGHTVIFGGVPAKLVLANDITERKRLEDELKAAVARAEDEKAKSESIIEAIGDGVTIQDTEYRILYQNAASRGMLGDHVGELCHEAYEKREKRCEGCGVARVFADGETHIVERSAPTEKGILYAEIIASPLRDSRGNIIAGIEVIHNITERKLREEALRTSEEMHRLIFQGSPVGIFHYNTGLVITDCNDRFVEILKTKREKLIGLDMHVLRDQRVLPSLESSTAGTEGWYEGAYKASGRAAEIIISMRTAPLFDPHGQVMGGMGIIDDITEHRKNEVALEQYGRELTALNEASDTLMLITNRRDIYEEICNIIYSVFDVEMVWLGIIEEGNPVVKPVAFAGREDGYLSAITVTWDDSPAGRGPTGMAIKTKKPQVQTVEDPAFVQWRAEAEKRGYVVSIAIPLIYARDKCVGALHFYSSDRGYFTPDRIKLCQIFSNQAAIAIENARLVEGLEESVVNRTRELEDANVELQTLNRELELRRSEAENASRLKTDFLANMSHELRTPLNAITGFTDIMQMGIAGTVTDKQKEYLTDISESAAHLLLLINDILDLSKVEAGKLELENSEFDLKELIESALAMFKEKSLKHGITATAESDEGVGSMTADRRKVKQVLLNLLSNAFKFTPDGGSVSVRARRVQSSEFKVQRGIKDSELRTLNSELDADFIEISVSDTGIGISLENQERLFQPFQQVETSLTRKYSGTGLGLSLCRRFVELHGGRIWIESEPGKGSTFTFVIPVKERL